MEETANHTQIWPEILNSEKEKIQCHRILPRGRVGERKEVGIWSQEHPRVCPDLAPF